MPTFVYMTRCDGCGHCVDICPSDIMHIDPTYRRAYNIEPSMCWECYSCVKTCPQGAIEMRGYADVMPMGSRVTPLRGTDSIMWAIQYRNGETKRFKYPIRTTAWGSIDPTVGQPPPTDDLFGTQLLMGEPTYLHIDTLPALAV